MFKRLVLKHLKHKRLNCILLAAFMFSLCYSNSLYAQIVTIPDPNLEANIRTTLGKPTGEITVSDMETIITLNANDRGIYSISGLEYAVNIENIYLQYNEISDLTPLAGLNKLKQLFLPSNQIQDLSGLSNLHNLKELVLWDNQISNLAPLANLKNIEELILTNNLISDISPLANLNSLKHITIWNNQIVDLSPLSGLSNLNWLYIGDNLIEDIEPLSDLNNLLGLSIPRNYIDISPGSASMAIINNFVIQGTEVDYKPQNEKTDETPTKPNPSPITDDSPPEQEPEPKNEREIDLGDINADGEINVRDVALLVQHVLGLNSLSNTQKLQADFNNDSIIDVRDVTLLTQYIMGYIESLT